MAVVASSVGTPDASRVPFAFCFKSCAIRILPRFIASFLRPSVSFSTKAISFRSRRIALPRPKQKRTSRPTLMPQITGCVVNEGRCKHSKARAVI